MQLIPARHQYRLWRISGELSALMASLVLWVFSHFATIRPALSWPPIVGSFVACFVLFLVMGQTYAWMKDNIEHMDALSAWNIFFSLLASLMWWALGLFLWFEYVGRIQMASFKMDPQVFGLSWALLGLWWLRHWIVLLFRKLGNMFRMPVQVTGRVFGITSMIATGVLTLSLLLIPLGWAGVHWWHKQFVTPALAKKVLRRGSYLFHRKHTKIIYSNKDIFTIYDRHPTDFDDSYKDPNLMQWKISRLVYMAEGAIRKPRFWWAFMPEGKQLRCEPFAIDSMLGAFTRSIHSKKWFGGSTPVVQLAKNIMTLGRTRGLSSFEKLEVKVFQELPIAYTLCRHYTPRQILQLYLLTVWIGTSNHYGLHRLTLRFFGVKNPALLTMKQAIYIVASLPNPAIYNPWYMKSCLKGQCHNATQRRFFKKWKSRLRNISLRAYETGLIPATQKKDLIKMIHQMGGKS